MSENGGATIKVCSINGVGMVGEVVSSVFKEKIIDDVKFEWETSLELEEGQKHIISGNYACRTRTNESLWRFELNPNYYDPRTGERFLSAYLTLVKLPEDTAVVGAVFNLYLPGSSGDTQDQPYGKTIGLTKFSQSHLTHGIPNFIPYIKLGAVGNPKSNEKFVIAVEMHIIQDAGIEMEDKRESPRRFTPEPPPFDVNEPLNPNGRILFGGDVFRVDTKRIRHYTNFFDKYIYQPTSSRREQEFKSPDLSKVDVFNGSKTLAWRIIDFCHTGKLSVIPKRLTGLANILKAAKQLNIIPLQTLCQDEILVHRLSVETFTDIVELAKQNCFDETVVYIMLYEFLTKEIGALEKNDKYRETFANNWNFYAKLMHHYEVELQSTNDNESESGSENT